MDPHNGFGMRTAISEEYADLCQALDGAARATDPDRWNFMRISFAALITIRFYLLNCIYFTT